MFEMELRYEAMNQHFEKLHLVGFPFATAFHHFTAPDPGDPHDHPAGFTSYVVRGWYIEEIYGRDGVPTTLTRRQGHSFRVPAKRIHRIIEVAPEGCTTLCQWGPHEQAPGFWQFRRDGAYYRRWNYPDFQKVTA